MAKIIAEAGTLQVTARMLHQLSTPDQIQFYPHEREGAVFVVPDTVAEAFALAVEAMDAEPEPEPEKFTSKRKAKG